MSHPQPSIDYLVMVDKPNKGYHRGVARIIGKGVLDYAREVGVQNLKPHPLINR